MNDYLDTVETQLTRLTETGAGGRGPGRRRPDPGRGPRRRRDVLLIVPALAIVIVVVAVMLTIGLGPHHSTPAADRTTATSGPSSPPAHSSATTTATAPITSATTSAAGAVPAPPSGPVPAGFAPESFTAIGTDTWWLLGNAPCASPPCTSIVRTDNGGQSFAGIPAPRTTNVTQLRFADAQDGFAYDPQLWATHDAGAHWHPVSLGGSVVDLAAGDGYVFAVVRSADGTGRLMRSPAGSDAWVAVASAGNAFGGLWTHGSEVLLESTVSADTGADIMISHDAGQSFGSAGAAPPSVACDLEAPAPPVVWAHCSTGMMSATWRSTDDGAHLTPAAGAGDEPNGSPELPNSAPFAAASASTAVVGYQQLYRTTDGGASYARVSTPAGITWWAYLGFTDPLHGVALGYAGTQTTNHERLFYTTDGGLSYHLVSIG